VTPQTFRLKAKTVAAIQWTGSNLAALKAFCPYIRPSWLADDGSVLEYSHDMVECHLTKGSWLIRHHNNEVGFIAMTDEEFHLHYEIDPTSRPPSPTALWDPNRENSARS